MQVRYSLSLVSGALLLSLPILASARVIDGATPHTPRSAEESVNAQSSDTTSVDTGESVDSEELMDVLEEYPSMDGKGGYYYPSMPGNGVSVDVSITKTVTPDYIGISAYCEAGPFGTRDLVKSALTEMYNKVKNAVGSDGKVRKGGSVGVYPYYDPALGRQTADFTGSMSLMVKIEQAGAAQKVSDAVENAGCSVSWDIRLVDAQDLELSVLDDLIARVNKRKMIFEKLLKRELTNITGASMSTWVDGYSTYDPETNTADATTNLSVWFETGVAR